jgi:hypothetical protein
MFRDTFNFLLIDGQWGDSQVQLLHKIWTAYDVTLCLFALLVLGYRPYPSSLHSGQPYSPHSLRIQVSWNMVLCHCVSGSWYYNHVPISSGKNQSIKSNQRWISFMDLSACMMKATQSLKHRTTHPPTHRQVPEDLNPQQDRQQNLKSGTNSASYQTVTVGFLVNREQYDHYTNHSSQPSPKLCRMVFCLSTQFCCHGMRHKHMTSSLFCLFQLVKWRT